MVHTMYMPYDATQGRRNVLEHWDWSLHLQMYVLVDLKNMGRNIYKTSTYNKSLRVISIKGTQISF